MGASVRLLATPENLSCFLGDLSCSRRNPSRAFELGLQGVQPMRGFRSEHSTAMSDVELAISHSGGCVKRG